MNALLSRWHTLRTRGLRSFLPLILLLLLVLIGGARLAEWLVVRHDDSHFDDVVDRQCVSYLATAVQSFADLQRTTRRIATEIAGQPAVVDFLSRRDTSEAQIFDAVVSLSQSQGVGVEIYDTSGSMVCWDGQSGPRHPHEVRHALAGEMTSYVTMTPIASQLFVTIPVRAEGAILGAVLVRRTIDVNYPLNNRYISRQGLTADLAHLMGVNIEFDFSAGAQVRKDGRYASTVLYGIDSSRVGVVSVLRPPRAAYLETVAMPYENTSTVSVVLFLLLLAVVVCRRIDRMTIPQLYRVVGVLAVIWGVRFALLGLDLGSIITLDSLFNPALFASQFGGGLAQSLGDMTLSILALGVSIWYLFSRLTMPDGPLSRPRKSAPAVVAGGAADVAIGLLLMWLLRGFGALARGVVFDSTIHLNDPRVIVPGTALSIMMADVLAAAVCLLLVGGTTVRWMLRLVSREGAPTRSAWLFVAVLLVVLSWVFGVIQENPVMETAHRLLFSVLVMIIAGVAELLHARGQTILNLRRLGLLLITAILLYYPLIDLNIRDKDRDRVESFAQEAVRPIDNWMSLIVGDGLNRLTDDGVVESLVEKDTATIARAAFVRWAQSLACREGYASLFELTDTTGQPVSRFAIGSQIQLALESDTAFVPSRARVVAMRGIGTGVTALHVYYGSAPAWGFDGNLLGYARVIVAAGPQNLFRGENPGVLRPAGPEGLRSFYRPVTVSEYHDGVVVTTNNPLLPIRRAIPPEVRAALESRSAVWFDETIGTRQYESYYIRRPDGNGNVVALSLQKPGLEWHLVGLVRLAAFCAVILLVGFGGILAYRRLRGERRVMSFRNRLLAAFLVTALIPLALSTIYSRYYARERHMAATSTRLSDYTLAIAQNLPLPIDSLQQITQETAAVPAEELATDVGTDFNIFEGNRLVMSSRPELFDAGILDRRLSGEAYLDAYVLGNRFFVETERIGVYEYAVGYRPLSDEQGVVRAVIGVPMLYRQDELNEEVAGRNAFLIAVYFVLFAGLVVLASLFAGRIAAPIQGLTEATRRIARGDLNVDLGNLHREGEIGALIGSFEQMAHDLNQSRENLVRAERELAWKEMARQVAHEIKNPLTPMRLAVQHMRMVYREGSEGFKEVFDDVTRTLLNQIDVLSRIASEFSHFGRMPRPQVEPCNINHVVEESVLLFDQEKGVAFELALAPSLPEIMADRDELRRAFINIVRNAMQAMNNGGEMKITTSLRDEVVGIVFHDTGPGIPADVKEKLFQPNFSTKTEGMGLGLAIVKKTIDDLRGSIRIESEPGHGTTVIVEIPAPAEKGRKEERRDL